MHTDIFSQQVHAAHLDIRRRQQALSDKQVRIARATRPSFAALVRTTIGTALIATGEWMRQEPVRSRGATSTQLA